jgi:transcriptional regulator with XRE-family HTH domain
MASKGFESRFPARKSRAIKALASNVRALRKEREWSQAKLAGEAGVEQNAISLIENGRSNPTIIVVEQIARTLCVPLSELLEGGANSRGPKK